MPDPPNLKDDVAAERARYADALLDADTCAAICNAVAWKHRDDGFGVSGKDFGNYGVRHDGAKISVDILHHRPSDHLIDVLMSAGNNDGTKGPATPAWQDHGPNTQPNRPWTAPIAPRDAPSILTGLGVSWFPAVGLYKHDRARYTDTMQWYRDVLRPNYARIFYYLAGEPWTVVGTAHLLDDERRELFQIVIEALLAIAVEPQVTIFGSAALNATRRRQIFDGCVAAIAPYAAQLFLTDCVNEPGMNGFTYAEVREVGRWLAAANLGMPIALASPDVTHMGVNGREATLGEVQADARKLYDGMPEAIDTITPHWQRNPWKPHLPLGLPLRVVNNEPRGYESSVVSITNPVNFWGDFMASRQAGDTGYTLHGEPGVWSGYCYAVNNPDWERHNSVPVWWAIPNIDEIVKALHAAREGRSYAGGDTPPPPPPGEFEPAPWPPSMDADAAWFGDQLTRVYQDGQQRPVDPLGWMRWGSEFRMHRANGVGNVRALLQITETIHHIWGQTGPPAPLPPGRYDLPWAPELDREAEEFERRLQNLYQAYQHREVDALGKVRWASDFRLHRARGVSFEAAWTAIEGNIKQIWGV